MPRGGACDLTLDASGTMTLDHGQGTGQFADADHCEFDLIITDGYNFHSVVNRVPYTTDDFPVKLESPVNGDPTLAGTWTCVRDVINPVTGEGLSSLREEIEVTVAEDRFRLDDWLGEYYQGVFERQDLVAFRVMTPPPPDAEFRSFPGSALSPSQNLIGEVRLSGDEHFTATLLLQTHMPVGEQQQTYLRYTAARPD